MKTPEEIVAEVAQGHANLSLIGAAAAIRAYTQQDGIEVQLWTAEHDGVRVVQIDTENNGRLRINLNDAPIWDGDPETDERPGAHFHDVWDDPDEPDPEDQPYTRIDPGERNWNEQDWPDAPVPTEED